MSTIRLQLLPNYYNIQFHVQLHVFSEGRWLHGFACVSVRFKKCFAAAASVTLRQLLSMYLVHTICLLSDHSPCSPGTSEYGTQVDLVNSSEVSCICNFFTKNMVKTWLILDKAEATSVTEPWLHVKLPKGTTLLKSKKC